MNEHLGRAGKGRWRPSAPPEPADRLERRDLQILPRASSFSLQPFELTVLGFGYRVLFNGLAIRTAGSWLFLRLAANRFQGARRQGSIGCRRGQRPLRALGHPGRIRCTRGSSSLPCRSWHLDLSLAEAPRAQLSASDLHYLGSAGQQTRSVDNQPSCAATVRAHGSLRSHLTEIFHSLVHPIAIFNDGGNRRFLNAPESAHSVALLVGRTAR